MTSLLAVTPRSFVYGTPAAAYLVARDGRAVLGPLPVDAYAKHTPMTSPTSDDRAAYAALYEAAAHVRKAVVARDVSSGNPWMEAESGRFASPTGASSNATDSARPTAWAPDDGWTDDVADDVDAVSMVDAADRQRALDALAERYTVHETTIGSDEAWVVTAPGTEVRGDTPILLLDQWLSTTTVDRAVSEYDTSDDVTHALNEMQVDFWSEYGPKTLWHGTDNDKGILGENDEDGDGILMQEETRTSSNRYLGRAVFTSLGRDVPSGYGSTIIGIDVEAMRKDGWRTRVMREPDVLDSEARASFAWQLGWESYEGPATTDPDTVILFDDIPRRYLWRYVRKSEPAEWTPPRGGRVRGAWVRTGPSSWVYRTRRVRKVTTLPVVSGNPYRDDRMRFASRAVSADAITSDEVHRMKPLRAANPLLSPRPDDSEALTGLLRHTGDVMEHEPVEDATLDQLRDADAEWRDGIRRNKMRLLTPDDARALLDAFPHRLGTESGHLEGLREMLRRAELGRGRTLTVDDVLNATYPYNMRANGTLRRRARIADGDWSGDFTTREMYREAVAWRNVMAAVFDRFAHTTTRDITTVRGVHETNAMLQGAARGLSRLQDRGFVSVSANNGWHQFGSAAALITIPKGTRVLTLSIDFLGEIVLPPNTVYRLRRGSDGLPQRKRLTDNWGDAVRAVHFDVER